MPRLNNRPPKYCKLNNYAVVYYHGKTVYLGRYGSPESKIVFSRFVAEIQANPAFFPTTKEEIITVRELTAAFLDHTKANSDPVNYSFYRVIVLDFIDKFYGDGTLVDDFTPRCLKLVREEMVKSRRFSRKIINRNASGIIFIFAWGVENELVRETTWRALKAVKPLQEGYEGPSIPDVIPKLAGNTSTTQKGNKMFKCTLKLFQSQADITEGLRNTAFSATPTEISEVNAKEVFRFDHTPISFNGKSCHSENFQYATLIPFDIDNDDPDTPEIWDDPAAWV